MTVATMPMCRDDWYDRNPDMSPAFVHPAKPETCAWCGHTTMSGIYVRADTDTAPHYVAPPDESIESAEDMGFTESPEDKWADGPYGDTK